MPNVTKSRRGIFLLGCVLMFSGVIGAGVTYRDMRAQRVLHEPVRTFKLDPSVSSPWRRAELPVYRNGQHALLFSVSAPSGSASTPAVFRGSIEVVIEDQSGRSVLDVRRSTLHDGVEGPDRVIRFPLDSLSVENIQSSSWAIQIRCVAGDPQYAGSLAELVLVPPNPEEFAPYLQGESFKLFGSGLLIVAGFLIVIVPGRRAHKRAPATTPVDGTLI